MTAARPLFDRIHAAVTVEDFSLIGLCGKLFYRAKDLNGGDMIEATDINELMAAIDAAKEGTK